MTLTTEDHSSCLLAALARRFGRAIVREALLERVMRLETTLYSVGTIDRLFAVEEAVVAAWPSANIAGLHHEFYSATERRTGETLRFRAFDGEGALLLEQSYRLDDASSDALKSKQGELHV